MTSPIKNIGEAHEVFEKQLGQSTPADTNAASIYSPGTNVVTAQITAIVACNTSGSDATYRLFHDNDGTTYSTATALFYDEALAANSTEIISVPIFMNDPDGNIAIRSSSANDITFTVYGIEIINPQLS